MYNVIITGFSGFIASNLLKKLIDYPNIKTIFLVENWDCQFDKTTILKCRNLNKIDLTNDKLKIIQKGQLFSLLQDYDADEYAEYLPLIMFNLGANSSTLNKEQRIIDDEFEDFQQYCAEAKAMKYFRIIHASSFAVYGNGQGPLNLYAKGKLKIDNFIYDQFHPRYLQHIKPNIISLRFTNVYSTENEAHKENMMSCIHRWFHLFQENKQIELFKNSKETKRDFIFVEDLCDIMIKCAFDDNFKERVGIFDLGTSNAISFWDVYCQMKELFPNYNKEPKWVDMPKNIINQYQNYSCAYDEKWDHKFKTIKEAVNYMLIKASAENV